MSIEDFFLLIIFLAPFCIILIVEGPKIKRLFKVSTPKLLLFQYILFNHIGLLYLHYYPPVYLNPTYSTTILLSCYTLIVVAAYYLSSVIIAGSNYPRKLDKISFAKDRPNYTFILFICMVSLIFLYGRLENSPLLNFFQDPSVALDLRLDDYVNKKTIFGIKERYVEIIFVALIAFSNGLLARSIVTYSSRDILLFILTTFLFLFFTSANLSKGSVAFLFINFLIISAVTKYNFCYLNRVTVYVSSFALIILSILSVYIMGGDFNILYPFERLFLGNLVPQYVIVDEFNIGNLSFGAHIPSWWTLGLHEQFHLEEHAWKVINGYSGGLFYTAPSSFVAEAHSAFHFAGVVMFSLIAFSVCRIFDYQVSKIKSDFIFICIFSWGAMHLSYISVQPMINWVVDYKFWGCVLIVGIFYRKRIRFSSNRRKIIYE